MKEKGFELSENTRVVYGLGGKPSSLLLAVDTGIDYREAVVPLPNNKPEALLAAYAKGLEVTLGRDYPEVTDIILGQGSLDILNPNEPPQYRVGLEFVHRCNEDVSYGFDATPEGAVRKAVVQVFERVLE